MRIIGVQGRLEEEPGDGLEELMAKQCVVTETCDAESLRTSAVLLAATGPAAKKIAATDTEPPVDRKGMTAAEVLALQADISRADSLFASQGTSRLPQAPSRAKAKAAKGEKSAKGQGQGEGQGKGQGPPSQNPRQSQQMRRRR